jgi:predicted amidohydrolase
MLTHQLLQLHPGLEGRKAIEQVAVYTDRYVALFKGLATEHKVNLVGGTHCVVEGATTLNVSYLFHRGGKVERQTKLHVTPTEKSGWALAAGDAVEVFDTDCGKVAINICYDVEFPEIARVATERGARILCVPYCTEDRMGHLRVRYCAQARAVENQIYVATAGVCGNLRGVDNMDVHYAQSGIFTPSDFGFARDGVAAECPPCQEAVAVADVDLAHLEHMRQKGTVRNWADRRTDLFKVDYRG